VSPGRLGRTLARYRLDRSNGRGEVTGGDPAGWPIIDRVLTDYLAAHAEMHERWLLLQTLATTISRRSVLATLPVERGWRVLDVGTGFGVVPMELAALQAIDAVGIDIDPEVLTAASSLRDDIVERGGLLPDSRLTFTAGHAHALDQSDASIDLATARFVFQHLRDHAIVASELARVVRPGGFVCVIDVDDGLSVSYPTPSAAYARLTGAVAARQERRGGGRHVGRTLPSRLDAAGFDIHALYVLPQAAYGSSLPDDLNRTLLVERFVAMRPGLVEEGFITSEEFDDCLDRFAAEVVTGVCTIEAHMAIIGRRRT
jgi:ubiquinone/menaquinone biosynthesis C-methylase UbiE